MKRAFDFSRPDLVFGVLWSLVLVLNAAIPISFTVDADPTVQHMVIFNIVSFFVIYQVVKLLAPRRQPGTHVDAVQEGSWDATVLSRFLKLLLILWGSIYPVSILYSGGPPFLWVLHGSDKSYGDFGVPTFTGLLNMIRAFVLSGYVLLYLQTKRRRYLLVPLFLIFTALLEISRGAILVLLSQALGIVMLRRNVSLKMLARLAVMGVILVVAFGVIGDFRGTPVDEESLAGEQEWLGDAPPGVLIGFAYVVSPLNNLYYGAESLQPSYTPYFTFATLLPTILRSVLFPDIGQGVYPIDIKNEAFNATTFYSPLASDFGWYGAGAVACLLQFICAYVHVRAKRGSLYFTLIYPPLYMSVVLSVFYMYFFSLVTVCYPLLGALYLRYRNARLARRESLGESGSLPPESQPQPGTVYDAPVGAEPLPGAV